MQVTRDARPHVGRVSGDMPTHRKEKNMTKIDKNIPFPVHREGHGYPWHRLDVGESFVYQGTVLAAQQAAFYYSRKTNKTFKARTVDNVVRVWRIE